MTAAPHFSVIITAYERPELLRRALESVLKQTFPNFEVIVVDDGSRQALEGVVAHYRSDQRVSYLRIENGGPGRARRLGCESARGNWLCFLDDDDRYLRHHLGCLYPHTEGFNGLLTTRMRGELPDGGTIRVPIPDPLALRTYWDRPFGLPTFAVPRRVATVCPSSDHRVIEDFEWLCRLLARYPVRVIQEETVAYSVHDGNRTSQLVERKDLVHREAVVRELYRLPEVNRQISSGQYRRQLLHQRMHWVRQAARQGFILRAARELPSVLAIRDTGEVKEWARTIWALVAEPINNPIFRRRLRKDVGYRFNRLRLRMLLPLYRYQLGRKQFLPRDAYLIAATPRSGSTWLMEMLAQLPGMVVNYEPFGPDRPGFQEVGRLGIVPVVNSHTLTPALRRHIERILQFDHPSEWTGQRLTPATVRKASRVLIKCVRANQALRWIVDTFAFTHPPVVLLRHPLSTVVSMLHTFRSRPLPIRPLWEANPRQYARYLPQLDYLDSLTTDLERWVAQWCVDNESVLTDGSLSARTIRVYYERLLLDPHQELNRILDAWGISPHATLPLVIDRPSATDHRGALRQSPEDQLRKAWKLTSPEERERVQAVLDHFGVTVYSCVDPLPRNQGRPT
jgi:glycosyltransferase involved in cell wall biosynthesis